MADVTYSQKLNADGAIALDQARRSDGALVLTGLFGHGDEPMAIPGFDDPDGLAYQAWLAAGNTPGAPQPDLAAYAAAARYAKETGGIKVGTATIDTSRESQAMIANAYQFMQVSGAETAQYKTASGWVAVNADQMKTIALAVGTHVQACFAAESDIDSKIAAGTITTAAEIEAVFASLTT